MATLGLILDLFLILLAWGAQDSKPPAAAEAVRRSAEDLERLQGTWACVSWTYDGMDASGSNRGLESIYEGNRLTLRRDGVDYRHGIVTLDASRSPRAMNTWDLDGPSADQTNAGIYELDGDSLKVCIALDGKARPASFTSERGSGRLLIEYRKTRP